jgi:hypothetical protein
MVRHRNSIAHNAICPALAGDNEKVMLRWAIPAYLTERNVEAFGAHPRSLLKHNLQIRLSERKRSEQCQRLFSAKEFFDLFLIG